MFFSSIFPVDNLLDMNLGAVKRKLCIFFYDSFLLEIMYVYPNTQLSIVS
jgi:hypothetical protein